MIGNPPRAARSLVVLSVITLGASGASAGPVLLSRESDIRASGVSAAGEYLLSNSSGDFGTFADGLLSDAAAAAHSSAHQHSRPQLDAAGVLVGASAEGSARASVDSEAIDAFSDADTGFDLVFRIEDGASVLTFDGMLAANGDASTGLLLLPRDDAGGLPVISLDVADEERTVRQSTVLEPGTYGLSVWAFARGTPGESAASYAMSVSLDDGEPGGVPMPLPAAAWGGLAGLAVVGLMTYRRRVGKGTTGQGEKSV